MLLFVINNREFKVVMATGKSPGKRNGPALIGNAIDLFGLFESELSRIVGVVDGRGIFAVDYQVDLKLTVALLARGAVSRQVKKEFGGQPPSGFHQYRFGQLPP